MIPTKSFKLQRIGFKVAWFVSCARQVEPKRIDRSSNGFPECACLRYLFRAGVPPFNLKSDRSIGSSSVENCRPTTAWEHAQ